MDGPTLYTISSDDTMAIFSFDPEELEELGGVSARKVPCQIRLYATSFAVGFLSHSAT